MMDRGETSRYQGWTSEAIALVERAVSRHGGWQRWQRPYQVRCRVNSLSGILPAMKGLSLTYPRFGYVSTFPSRCRTVFDDYPRRGVQSVFQTGDVWMTDGESEVQKSVGHRQTFRGLRKHRMWSPLDAVYFFGYAIWHYHTLPFTLGDCRFVRLCTGRKNGIVLNGIEVDLPADVVTHNARQSFYFDDEGLLRRHDYVAEIISAWARGAHFWDSFERRSELLIATRRSVAARIGRFVTPIRVLSAEIQDVEIHDL